MASLDFTSSFIYDEAGNSSNYQQGSFDPTDGVLTDNNGNDVFEFGEPILENGVIIGTFNGTFTDGTSTWIVVQTVPSSGPNSGQWKVFAPEGVVDVPPNTIKEGELDRGDYIIPCFVSGTLIQTNTNKRPIEVLQPGDLVQTMDHGFQPIRWIGSRKLTAVDLRLNPKLRPVRIRAGALGKNEPSRDLMVSPQHRMLICGWRAELFFGQQCVLAAAKHLVNCDTIYQYPATEVEYFHIMFEEHEIILAEDAPSESFHPGHYVINRLEKDTRDEILVIFPELQNKVGVYGPTARKSLKRFESTLLQAVRNLE